MNPEDEHYLSYMLRLWQASDKGQIVWRASLESPQTGERLGFASLDLLVDFLQTKTEQNAPDKKQMADT